MNSKVTVTVFGEIEETEMRALITKIDRQQKRIKVEAGPDEWE